MASPVPPADRAEIPYATPVNRRPRIGLALALVGAALGLALLAWAVLLRRGYSVRIQVSPPATAPATAPAAAAPAGSAWAAQPTAPPPLLPPPPPPSLTLSESPTRLTIPQRRSETIPGSNGTVSVALGDITGGRVQVEVSTSDGQSLASRTLHEGEGLDFNVGGKRFVAAVTELRTRLMGQDRAVLSVRRADDPPTEEERIGRLVTAAEKTGATVVTADGAATPVADQLRSVWRLQRTRISTAADLARVAGEASSAAKAPEVRLPDGSAAPIGPWLKTELDKLK